jgi:hypothetical protein
MFIHCFLDMRIFDSGAWRLAGEQFAIPWPAENRIMVNQGGRPEPLGYAY